MRKSTVYLRLMLITAMSAALSGCAWVGNTIKNDFHHTGGAVGGLIESRQSRLPPYYYANGSKAMVLYRSIVGMALILKVGVISIRDGGEADAYVRYLQSVNRDINNLAGHLKAFNPNSCDTRPTDSCKDHELLFESDLPPLEMHMLRLGMASLPGHEASNLIKNVTSQNPLGIATATWQLGKKVVVAGHNAAATARSERELLALLHNKSAKNVEQAVNQLKEVDNADFSFSKAEIEPLFWIIRDTCLKLPYSNESTTAVADRKEACKGLQFNPNANRYEAPPAS